MTRILVTGSEGFIGRHLVAALQERGYDVVGVDLRTGQDIRSIDYWALEPYDAVYHLAARTNAQSTDAYDDAETNELATVGLMQRYGNRLIFASSSMVHYPVNSYAISKLAGELYARLHGCHVLRLCNVWGPGGHSAVDRFQAAAEAGNPVYIHGTGEQVRTYAHVDRAVEQFLGMLGRVGRTPEHVYVLRGVTCTVNVLAGQRAPACPRVSVPASPLDLPYAPQRPPRDGERWAE